MKINLIGTSFDINSGQGVYKYSGEILNELKKQGFDVTVNSNGDINHVQQPELIWRALFKKNVITTIHDIIPIVYGERKFLFRIFFYFSILVTCLKSKKIICDSHYTKRDLERFFPFVKNKLDVVYLGYDSKKFYPLKKKNNKEFIVGYIGGLGKRKNVKIILKVAKELEKENILFKIAGKGPELEKLLELTNKLNLKNVEFVGFIPENRINLFYNSLDLFLFPSFYEGFGLPVLEAMACGVPVMVSDRASLPEIVGDAGVIIDIENLRESVRKIKEIIKDKRLQKTLIKRGINRANNFNVDKMLEKTLKVYRMLCKL